MSKQFIAFILRWILNSLGIWVAVRIFGTGYSNAQIDSSLVAFFGAGLANDVLEFDFCRLDIKFGKLCSK